MSELKKYFIEFKDGTKKMFKDFFNKETNKKQRANMWTFSRLLVTPIIPLFMILGLPILATTTVLFGAMTDFFDGRSARKHNSSSEYGRLLDLVVDKIFSMVIGISLTIINPLFLINLICESFILITNSIYQLKNTNIKIESSRIGKIKQWPLALTFVLGYVSAIFPVVSLVTNVSIIVTAVFQLITLNEYIKSNEKKVKLAKKIDEIKDYTLADEKELQKEYTLKKLKQINDKKEQYLRLKDVLTNVIYKRESELFDSNENLNEDEIIQKTKK